MCYYDRKCGAVSHPRSQVCAIFTQHIRTDKPKQTVYTQIQRNSLIMVYIVEMHMLSMDLPQLIAYIFPANAQRHNNVASTSLRRHDVAAASKQRYNNVMC